MKLAWLAPPPDAPTGVAHYASSLLRHLKPLCEIDDAAALRLYHIGNNDLHWEIYRQAIARPGVVLLHDACLHHLLLNQLTREQYIDEFVYNYGEWFREPAARYWANRGGSAADARYFERPMLRRIAETAKLVIVHNAAAAQAVAQYAPVFTLPHLFEPPREHSYREVDEYRANVLGVAPEETLFAVLGHLRESKRLHVVIDVLSALRRHGLPVRLLAQGKFVGTELERALADRLAEPWIVRRDYLPEDEWWMQAHAIDVGINLRWPLAGESSGIATRLMGIGKPVVLTRSLESSDIPAAAAIQIDPGLAEREQLEHYAAWLTLNIDARRSIGRHAAIHTTQHHSAPLIAARLAEQLALQPPE